MQQDNIASPIAFYLPNLAGGGVQRIVLKIASALSEQGHTVDLVVGEASGELSFLLKDSFHLHVLKASPYLTSRLAALRADPSLAWLAPQLVLSRYLNLSRLPDLARYLVARRPAVLFAATPPLNILAVLARRLAKVPVRLVISEHSHFSVDVPKLKRRARRLIPAMRRAYLQADKIIAVSHGVAEDLVQTLGISSRAIEVVYNPIVSSDWERRLSERIDHPWFGAQEIPVVIAVGRLARQKDYPTLLRAFAKLRASRPVRLAILGSGKAKVKTRLEALAKDLKVADWVAFLGFQPNPLPYIARANLLVLSSRWEGLPNVLIEALACGTPVVSTDCPSGPAEILENGRYGRLVPVGDVDALARAMAEVLDWPPKPELLKARARDFEEAKAIEAYRTILIGMS